MKLSDNHESTVAKQDYKQPFDFVSDFEWAQSCFDRVANLMELYHEMLEADWSNDEDPAPYIMERYWKRRGLYFSQFEAIESLFRKALGEMADIVKNSYDYCWKLKREGEAQDGERKLV